VALSAVTDPNRVVATIATTLGLREAAGETFDQALARHLQGKHMLLELDNVEQLLPAIAAVLGSLLAITQRVQVLATSREVLRVSGEQQYSVEPLSNDDARTFFLDRARAMRQDFELREDDRAAVEAICARLDRLPLALELAAARIKHLPPRSLLSRLERRLPVLVGGARDAPERQRTLGATIAWSYDLLAAEERRLFARLAVFSGGCTLESAESVCGATLDGLASLIDKSLLRGEEGIPGEPRYVMLETIREFALERIRTGFPLASPGGLPSEPSATGAYVGSPGGSSYKMLWRPLGAAATWGAGAESANSTNAPRFLHAEADGNRTRLRALARTPVLKFVDLRADSCRGTSWPPTKR
jgi:predicted ATPase